MIEFIALLLMIFLHIVDDYYLQGVLANMKQRGWWEKNAPDRKYKNDYLMALAMHAFSWTFMIMLPAIVYHFILQIIITEVAMLIITFSYIFILNWTIHFLVDNAKANNKALNLIQDQLIHIGQIVFTWFMFFILPIIV